MADASFRFLHAADFHLETPPGGIAEIPPQLRDLFLDSIYYAAERVFETAVSEEVEFIVLAGDILDPQLTGPRGPLFLSEQFARLAARGIAVYWAGGRVDPPDAWPSSVKLPGNVYLFPQGKPGEVLHHRDGAPIARLEGASRVRGKAIRPNQFGPDPGGLYSIAVVHGKADPEAFKARGVHYWALGGSHTRQSLLAGPLQAHYPGTPQGRKPSETGAHGCLLVTVDAHQQARTTLVPCDWLRWHEERLLIEETTDRRSLENQLLDRLSALTEAAAGVQLLVSWSIAGSGVLLEELRRGTLAAELLDRLRAESGEGRQAAWSTSLAAEPPERLPADWYDQQTVLGDFLREVRRLEMNPDAPLDLQVYLGQSQAAGPIAELVAMDPDRRVRALREAALLGVELLRGEGSAT